MRPFALLCVTGLSIALARPELPQTEHGGALADRAFAAYAAGDVGEIRRRLTADGNTLVIDLLWRVPTWKRVWNPRYIAFTAEVALETARQHSRFTPALFDALRGMVEARPEKPGEHAAHDAFEVTVHQVAMAALVVSTRYSDAQDYYAGLSRRLAPPGATPATPAKLVAPRIYLARAVAREGHTRAQAGIPLSDALNNVLPVPPTRPPSGALRNIRTLRTEAHEALKDAAKDPATAAEAVAREAYLYLRAGNPKQAETLLLAMPKTDDPVVGYWGGLVLARALDALGRSDEAARVYEVLARIAPGTQTVAIALAAVRLRQGDRSAAIEWAARARATPANRVDPWTLYWGGDARFLDQWLRTLRAARE